MVKTMLSTLRWYHVVDDMTTALTLNLTLTLTLVKGQKTAPEAKTRRVWTPKFDIRQYHLTSEGYYHNESHTLHFFFIVPCCAYHL